jgi:membrane protein implicated in regulation of membrane protease activity
VYPPVRQTPPQRRGLGIAALVLGIASLLTLALCGLGVLLALAGLVIGVIAIVQRNGRGMAVAGLLLSALTLVLAIGLAVWLYDRIAPCSDQTRYPTREARDQCLQKRVPFFKASPTP